MGLNANMLDAEGIHTAGEFYYGYGLFVLATELYVARGVD